MAEHSFQEVMRQFDRMCNANSGCINCPLHQNDYYSDDECHIGAFVSHPEKIEQTVMQWAEAHPEPVYPTWYEYLCDMYHADWDLTIANKRIPTDIAEKLGIEPKEG